MPSALTQIELGALMSPSQKILRQYLNFVCMALPMTLYTIFCVLHKTVSIQVHAWV